MYREVYLCVGSACMISMPWNRCICVRVLPPGPPWRGNLNFFVANLFYIRAWSRDLLLAQAPFLPWPSAIAVRHRPWRMARGLQCWLRRFAWATLSSSCICSCCWRCPPQEHQCRPVWGMTVVHRAGLFPERVGKENKTQLVSFAEFPNVQCARLTIQFE